MNECGRTHSGFTFTDVLVAVVVVVAATVALVSAPRIGDFDVDRLDADFDPTGAVQPGSAAAPTPPMNSVSIDLRGSREFYAAYLK